MGNFPVMFLDSMETGMSTLDTLNPLNISNVTIVTPKSAKKLLGAKGNDGAVYVTTVKAARNIYWNFFRTRSDEYRQLIPSPEADTIINYILNGKPLPNRSAPGSLFLINKKNFKSLQITDSPGTSKRYTVSITAKKPKGQLKTGPAQ